MRVGTSYVELTLDQVAPDGKTIIPIKDTLTTMEIWHKDGEVHRIEGPARILSEKGRIKQEMFYLNGELRQKRFFVTKEKMKEIVENKYFFCERLNKNFTIVKKVCETHCKEQVYLSICDDLEKCFLIFGN